MVMCCKRKNKSMSDSNIEVLQKTNKDLLHDVGSRCKECCTFSGQHNPPFTTNIPIIKENVLPPTNVPQMFANNSQQCTCPPCSCPPYPYPPQDDLWDLQFCRWWGWNWIRKRDELVNKQKQTRCKSPAPRRSTKKRRNPKQDDFFSWCNKFFKGRQKECPLKTKEKQQLQEMYDTPSIVTVSKCCQSSSPNWDCKSINFQRRKCYCNSCRQTSLSTVFIKNKTRREIEKCNKRKHQSWLCEKGESSSSEEYCPHVCCYSKSPLSSTEESVEYLALRMECLNSDDDENVYPRQKQIKCCQNYICPAQIKNKYGRNTCPCKFKFIRGKKFNNDNSCKQYRNLTKMSDPYNSQFSQWHCFGGRRCPCINDASTKYPQFCRFAHRNKNCSEAEEGQTPKRKEYIIHCPLVHCKRTKHHCNCCYNSRYGNRENRHNNYNVMIDKSVSCPDINTNLVQSPSQKTNQYQNIFPNYKNVTLDNIQNSLASSLKNGQFSSPVSGKTYELSPRLVPDTSLPTSLPTRFPNPIDIKEKFLNFYNNTSETLSSDKEHNIILAAVCEAIMTSHASDQESDKIVDEEQGVSDIDYMFIDNYHNSLNQFNNYNFINKFDTCTQKPVECTDKFVGQRGNNGRVYETMPFKSVKKARIAGSRIPLLKRRKTYTNSATHSSVFEIPNIINSEPITTNVPRFNSNIFVNKCELSLNSNHIENGSKKLSKFSEDNIGTNTISFKPPWSLICSRKIPGISINRLFPAISNKFVNRNNFDKIDKKVTDVPNTVQDSIKFYSKTSQSSEQHTHPTLPNFLQEPMAATTQSQSHQGLLEEDFDRHFQTWDETLYKYVSYDTSPNTTSFKCQSISATDLSSSTYSNNTDFDLYSAGNNNKMQSSFNFNQRINASYDLNYLENTSLLQHHGSVSSSNSFDTETTNNKYLTLFNTLQKEALFNENSRSDSFQDMCLEKNKIGFSGDTSNTFSEAAAANSTSKNVTANAGARKSRIPIHDNLRDCSKLLPIIEEHNATPETTSKKFEKTPNKN